MSLAAPANHRPTPPCPKPMGLPLVLGIICLAGAASAFPTRGGEWLAGLSSDTWSLRLVNSSRARCLDGTRPGYYAHLGSQRSSIVFHMQGVSWLPSAIALLTRQPPATARQSQQPRPRRVQTLVVSRSQGGWCYNETNCAERAKTSLGSSATWPATADLSNFALFVHDSSINTLTHNWTTVYVK